MFFVSLFFHRRASEKVQPKGEYVGGARSSRKVARVVVREAMPRE